VQRAFTADELGQAASECARLTAMALIREHGNGEVAIDFLAEASARTPPQGDEVLDAGAIAAQAIRQAMDMGVVPR
jgi:hypothetical protein